jgi:hypothetical protein
MNKANPTNLNPEPPFYKLLLSDDKGLVALPKREHVSMWHPIKPIPLRTSSFLNFDMNAINRKAFLPYFKQSEWLDVLRFALADTSLVPEDWPREKVHLVLDAQCEYLVHRSPVTGRDLYRLIRTLNRIAITKPRVNR